MPEIQEYKGNKILNLNPESKFSFSFGLAKAKLILENLDVIKKIRGDGRQRSRRVWQ